MATKKSKKICNDAVNWYKENRSLYEQLTKKIESVIHELIKDKKIPIHAIYSRAKDIDSFEKKIYDHNYDDPYNQVTDLAGIRIIAYVENDLDSIKKLLRKNFVIDQKNSIDKTQTLGIDKVGYRSIHFIAKLPATRIKLPEYKKFDNLCFEIQIRTLLQHAWAEIEHDKNYKFSGKLPDHLIRRFKIIAGVLELADREFNEIALEIDKYIISVNKRTKEGELEIPIDSTSIKLYLDIKFKKLIEKGMKPEFIKDEHEKTVLNELTNFGILTLKQLDEIIPKDFISKIIKYEKEKLEKRYNYVGLLRHLMLITDIEKYFKECWKNSWTIVDSNSVKLIESYNKKSAQQFQINKIKIR